MPYSPRYRRAFAAAAAATALSLMPPSGIAQAAAPEPGKIHATVLADLAADDRATFWVHLKGAADLSAAATAATKDDKAAAVYRAKTTFAAASQAELRTLLTAAKADFTPYWLVNSIRVTGDSALAESIAKFSQVTRIDPVRTVQLPKPEPAKAKARVNAVEWNLDRVNAPRVWNELRVRGEGVVVANIDTGVQSDHPALAAQYRGTKSDGTVDHNYNWYDPTRVCTAGVPCDNTGHGTHTMGTMVGDDGGANTVGVAPGAKWIAAKGCATSGCGEAALLLAGQWVLAPTDLNGANPRPDLAPDIVNFSVSWWNYYPGYKETVEAWNAAGIFPAVANGNSGWTCQRSDSPGQYALSYSAGAFDANNDIMETSSRGPAQDGEVKPNIAAPGVDVRSSTNNGGYASMSGTSMAAPHVAATVALIWSASPTLRGDIAATRKLLDRTAVDTADRQCGGTKERNNVWGEGRLDAFGAVKAAPAGEPGALRGTVTSGGGPVAGATVKIGDSLGTTVVTGADGTYTVPRLAAGQHRVTAGGFALRDAAETVTVTAGQTATRDFELAASPPGALSGTVTAGGAPVAGATVAAAGTSSSAITDGTGRYRLPLPHGTYQVTATSTSGCAAPLTATATVDGDSTRDLVLPRKSDSFGYECELGTEPYVAGTDRQPITGASASRPITLPFPFPLYEKSHTSGWIHSNGYLSFGPRLSERSSSGLPSAITPNAAVYAFWEILRVDNEAGIYTATLGTAPNRTFVAEWRNVSVYGNPTQRISFSALLGEDGSIGFRYQGLDNDLEYGATATVGLENSTGRDAFEFSSHNPGLRGVQSLTFTPSRHGLVTGLVTDANDGGPLPGATVRIGSEATVVTGADGRFLGQVTGGDHRVEVSKELYGTAARNLTVVPHRRVSADLALTTGHVTGESDELTLVMPAGVTRRGSLKLTNHGRAATVYTVVNDPGQSWLSLTPTGGDLASGASVTLNATASSDGVAAGTVRTGKVRVRSASGRLPELVLTVNVVVPRHQVAVDAGGGGDVTDAAGDRWTPDRAYQAGGHGYMGTGTRAHTANQAILGTGEQELFKTAREGMLEYRFDQVPNGVYTVELGFADTRDTRPGARVFDVYAEGRPAVPMLDLALSVGTRTALTKHYTVRVADGQLNLRFVKRAGDTLVNTIRISERPDKTLP
ncbi:S8 family serine peptidase [Sinosporangium siamense]|uniref:Alpha-amylase n=1 Tax=Sinosporangium siamense TaxID=1367973 RepID=A0A919RDV1_9ACTN|nr:S8 family serine peptidase [Sinosporangium siamense]GII91897.1 hypothetical protein Ssi02_21280 [Sinosporangium siamense]